MPICYSFATVRRDSQAALETASCRSVDSLTVVMPTICARVTGSPVFHYLLKFQFQTLEEVATTILMARTGLGSHITQTLTIVGAPPVNEAEAEVYPSGRDPNTVGAFQTLLLVESLSGKHSLDSVKTISLKCEDITRFKCAEVFGPCDYVMEFSAENEQEATRIGDLVTQRLSARVRNITRLRCEIFCAGGQG
jgi:hypothetical protein